MQGSRTKHDTPRAISAALALLLASSGALFAADKPKVDESLLQKDFPFQDACIGASFPSPNVAMKGIAIRLSNGANVLFDTDLCRMAAGWKGGYITTHGVNFDGEHGGHPKIVGEQIFGTSQVPGIAAEGGSFTDTRPEPFGPMNPALARWEGIHVSGMDVQLDYTVLGAKVQEQPSSLDVDGQIAFVRTFKLDAPAKGFLFKSKRTTEGFAILLADLDGGSSKVDNNIATVGNGGFTTTVAGVGLPSGAKLKAEGGRISLSVPAGTSVKDPFKVVIWRELDVMPSSGATASNHDFRRILTGLASSAVGFKDFSTGGPAHWPQTVDTKGTLGKEESAYVVDSLSPPIDNPWKRRVRLSGMDFFSDGTRAALCTWDGDIWIVSGIDEGLQNLKWKRYASGMYETIGLRIVNDVIYTSGRDQITRYYDFNNDGEADYYENFNNSYTSSEGFHEFVFDLQTDRAGNFYFAKAGPVRPGGRGWERIARDAGSLMRVSKDGKTLETIATGFRAPNGMTVNPWNDQITTGDNEGTWVPACPINWVSKGGFYGVEDLAHGKDVKSFQEPLCWMSHEEYDNSSGGQVWVDSDKWGPFSKRLLHMSYGQCALYVVMYEQAANGQMQGGVVRIPAKFASSAMRGRFNPKDGQLYVCGLQGWQTKAVKISGFDRVRYTGKPVYSVTQINYTPNGVRMTFTQPLDPKEAADPQNFSVRRWNYKRSSDYGSASYSLKEPGKKGRDKVEVTGAKLLSDGKTVEITLEDLKRVQQMEVKFNLKAKDGTPIVQDFQCTVNVVPESVALR